MEKKNIIKRYNYRVTNLGETLRYYVLAESRESADEQIHRDFKIATSIIFDGRNDFDDSILDEAKAITDEM